MTELSDELLVAYVDGQLAKDQNRAVEKVLKQDEVIARRTAALQEAHERLEFAFESILAGELRDLVPNAGAPSEADRLRGTVEDRWNAPDSREGKSRAALLAAGLICGVAGIALGIYAPPLLWPQTAPAPSAPAPAAKIEPVIAPPAAKPPAVEKTQARLAETTVERQAPQADLANIPVAPPTWQEQVARAHALVSRESLEVSLESQKNPYLLSFQLTKAIGRDVRGPDLRPDGYGFVRAQLLRLGDKPLAQMLYLPKTGQPLALYAMPGEGDAAPVAASEGSIHTVSWINGDVAYLLAADADEALLMRIAEKMRNEPREPFPQEPEAAAEIDGPALEVSHEPDAAAPAAPASDAKSQPSANDPQKQPQSEKPAEGKSGEAAEPSDSASTDEPAKPVPDPEKRPESEKPAETKSGESAGPSPADPKDEPARPIIE